MIMPIYIFCINAQYNIIVKVFVYSSKNIINYFQQWRFREGEMSPSYVQCVEYNFFRSLAMSVKPVQWPKQTLQSELPKKQSLITVAFVKDT